MALGDIGKAIGEGLMEMGNYSAKAAAQANSVSAASQAAQGAFNQQSADIANNQNIQAMMNQYQYNSAQASMANQFSENMWQRSADWNEEMWERQAQFNAEQAQIQREWQERMANTQYQRAVNDMSKAGLNPILAVTGGGVGTGVPGGAAATVGGASMGSAQGAMASGGLLGANAASEGNYTGQMEYLAGNLGLISMAIAGLSQATGAFGSLGEIGEGIMNKITGLFNYGSSKAKENFAYSNMEKGTYNVINKAYESAFGQKETFIRNNGSREFQWRSGHAKG